MPAPSPSMPSSSPGAPQEAHAKSADSDRTAAVASSSGLGPTAALSATTGPGAAGKKSRLSKRTKARKRAKKRDSKTRRHPQRLASLDALIADDEAGASLPERTDALQVQGTTEAQAQPSQEVQEPPADTAMAVVTNKVVISGGSGNSEPDSGHHSGSQVKRPLAPMNQQKKPRSAPSSPLLVRVLNQVRIATCIDLTDSRRSSSRSTRAVGSTTLREFSRLSTLTDANVVSPLVACSLAALVSLLCLLLLAVLWAGPQPLLERCASLDCRQARAFLDMLMDASVDPCKDFFWHACRRWVTGHFGGGTNFSGQALRDTLLSLKRALLDRDAVAVAARPVRFYRACSMFPTLPYAMTPSSLVERFRNDTSVLTMTDTAAVLRRVLQLSLMRRVSTLFSVALVDYHGNASLYLSRAKSLARKLNDVKHGPSFVEFLMEIVAVTLPLAPQIPSNDTKTTVDALLAFDDMVDSNESAADGTTALSAPNIDSLGELMGGNDWIESVNLLSSPSFQLTKASTVMCDGFESIKSTVEYFRRNFALGLLYIFIHILMEAGQFYYLKRFTFDRQDELERTCLGASQDALPPLWSNLFNNLSHSNKTEPSRVDAIFSRVRELSAQRPPIDGMTIGDRERAIAALRHVQLLEHNTSLSVLPNVLDGLNISEAQGDFPSLYIDVKTAETMRRLADPPSFVDVLTSSFLLTARVVYSKVLNTVVLPAALRRPPFIYSTRVPIEFDVASVGVLLAQAVFRAGLPSASAGDAAARWFDGNVDEFISCAEESAQSVLRTTLRSLHPEDALELFSLTRAIKIAHTVMRKDYEPLRFRRGYHEAWTVAQRTFFRRFCLLVCSSDVGSEGIVESRLRCMLPLLNMVEFTGAFECNEFPNLRKLRSCLSV
ncbi:uncharacterized protein [Dermacentor andersoni]|uniref:uncharacterized protein n=1 Tax=Dermacentor andersoni TaxID=34620 RepID=UPI00241790EE|nr:uncharacterized protein LOC129384921 [Dermacentor andersoni]